MVAVSMCGWYQTLTGHLQVVLLSVNNFECTCTFAVATSTNIGPHPVMFLLGPHARSWLIYTALKTVLIRSNMQFPTWLPKIHISVV